MTARQIPSKMKQIMAKALGTNFREVTEIVETAVPTPGPKEVLIKNRFVGINASDINFTSGRYDPTRKPPFPCGFEAVGEVVTAGSDAKVKVGQAVVFSKFGAFSEYIAVDHTSVIPIPAVEPAFLSLLVSGLTASISLEKEADLKPGKTVLVTAAAGGTGQFAVQIAKLAGCTVIGTCSSDEKSTFLKGIGCDRVVNYRKEDLDTVLAKEYPNGVDVVYECVGNEMFDAALKNLAVHGRLIVIGLIDNYQGQGEPSTGGSSMTAMPDKRKLSIPIMTLTKSASVRGFFLMHYVSEYGSHMQKLSKLYGEGKLKLATDKGDKASSGPFVGLDKVVDAVEYMYSRKNVGKVVVEVGREKSSL